MCMYPRPATGANMMQTLLKCRKFEVARRTFTLPNGATHSQEFVVHPGAVVVLPLLDTDHCLMLRQYRRALDRELWELPAGTLDIPGEPPDAAAARELQEETGYTAGRLEELCAFYPSPGILTERIRAFVATGLVSSQQQLDPAEEIQVMPMPVEDALAMVNDGRIEDAKTIITLLRWDMRRKECR